jgi:YggT family protein
MNTVIKLVHLLFTLYSIAIVIRVLLSWLRVSYYHPAVHLLIQITEPLLAPLRRYIPPMGGLDFTPMVALIILWIVEQLLVMMLRLLF